MEINSEITIRDYHKNDQSEVLKLLQLNTPKYFATEEEADLIDYLETKIERYFVILVNGKIAGSGGINFVNQKTEGRISWDMIHPNQQGKSLGKELLQYRIHLLNAMENIQKIRVRTSQLAFQFYEKQGFELKNIEKNYWAKGFDLYDMEYKKKQKNN